MSLERKPPSADEIKDSISLINNLIEQEVVEIRSGGIGKVEAPYLLFNELSLDLLQVGGSLHRIGKGEKLQTDKMSDLITNKCDFMVGEMYGRPIIWLNPDKFAIENNQLSYRAPQPAAQQQPAQPGFGMFDNRNPAGGMGEEGSEQHKKKRPQG